MAPTGAGVAMDDRFRAFGCSKGQARVLRHLSEIASVRSAEYRFRAPALGVLCFTKAREISDLRVILSRRFVLGPSLVIIARGRLFLPPLAVLNPSIDATDNRDEPGGKKPPSGPAWTVWQLRKGACG